MKEKYYAFIRDHKLELGTGFAGIIVIIILVLCLRSCGSSVDVDSHLDESINIIHQESTDHSDEMSETVEGNEAEDSSKTEETSETIESSEIEESSEAENPSETVKPGVIAESSEVTVLSVTETSDTTASSGMDSGEETPEPTEPGTESSEETSEATEPGTESSEESTETVEPSPEPDEEPEESVGPTILFFTDMESVADGEKPTIGKGNEKWTEIVEAVSGKKYVRATKDGEDTVLHIYCETGGQAGGPRAAKQINIAELTSLTVEFEMKTDNATAWVQYVPFTDSTAGTAIILWQGSSEEWQDIRIDIDLENRLFDIYAGDTLVKEDCTLDISAENNTLEFRFSGGALQPGTGVYFDDIKIWTNDVLEGIFLGNGDVNWNNVGPVEGLSESSMVNNLIESHPRIFVQSWEEIFAKITGADSYEIKVWYEGLKADADTYLITSPPGYTQSNGRNQLYEAREGERRLQTLAFVYNIEKLNGNADAGKYLEQAYSDMLVMGEWPDWSAFTADLVTAEIMFGYACAYDWLYDDLTEEQKETIFEIVKVQALTSFVYNYEGQTTSTNFTTNSINWNPVCNACAIGTALAFADEQPEIAEYILEKAPGFITNALEPYAEEGGYPEGVMYWDYGTTFLTFAMDLLDNGFEETYQLYTRYPSYDYAKADGIAQTADFPIYYNGTTNKFNYGDSNDGLVSSPVFYWMAEKFDKPEYTWYENKMQRTTGEYLSGYNAIAAICFYNPDNAVVEPGTFELDKFYYDEDGVNGISLRSTWEGEDTLFAAMQGGNNAENHMHYSLGTYVIDYHDQRFIKQLGEYNYSLTGGKETIYYKRAEASNTLVINPSASADQNPAGVATLLKYGSSDNTSFGILDMSDVYTAGSTTVESAKRGIMISDR